MPQNKTKILIIDYEPRGIKQMYEPLKNAGHEILLAKDGVTGFEIFLKENPDLVLFEAMLQLFPGVLPDRHQYMAQRIANRNWRAVLDFVHRDDNPTLQWEDDQRPGFAWAEIEGETFTVAFYDLDGNLDHEMSFTK